MTNKEAIAILRDIQPLIASPHNADRCVVLAIQAGIDALKAQEPVDPVFTYNTWECGCETCREPISEKVFDDSGEYEIRYKYCPECGRKVKWDV